MCKGVIAALGFLCLAWLPSVSPALGQTVKVEGRVLGADGAPAPGAEVASFWVVDQKTNKQTPLRGATADAEGRFSLKVETYGQDFAVMALDSSRKNGGLVLVRSKDAGKPIEVRLAPAVRLHGKFASKGLEKPPEWTNVYMCLDSKRVRVIQNPSTAAEFSMILPPGAYRMNAYGTDVRSINRPVTLRSDQPDLDLGTLDLPATMLAMHKGKELPPWKLADARGVKKDVTLADYRGKWVLVDVWGYWCGPCVRQLGELIDLYELHEADRDKFEILAFHDGSVKDFAEMDARTAETKKTIWRGRDLPFPILLDAPNGEQGATVKEYEIQAFPTSLLIDPEGKLVGQADIGTLEEKLPPVPVTKRIPRALDGFLAFGFDDTPVGKGVESFSRFGRIPIKFDDDALKEAGVALETKVPLKMTGGVSLRSWLELLLDPLGLEAKPGEDGLVIVKATTDPTRREPSDVQGAVSQDVLRIQGCDAGVRRRALRGPGRGELRPRPRHPHGESDRPGGQGQRLGEGRPARQGARRPARAAGPESRRPGRGRADHEVESARDHASTTVSVSRLMRLWYSPAPTTAPMTGEAM